MKITFKDVGQGDSIIIEWTSDDGTNKVGIVDCNLKGKTNPTLEHLKNSKYENIEFMILTHPHEDHYSGYLELLQYCEDSKITISRMGHTVGFIGAEYYWKYFEVNTSATNELTAVISKCIALAKKKIIKRIDLLTDSSYLKIDDCLSINCLSASNEDMARYMALVKLDAVTNEKEASRAANLLSTILKISYKENYFLLTSDAEKFTFRGALNRDQNHFEAHKFHVCQLPHHGSYSNYQKSFWEFLERFGPRHAIASAGLGYRHPSIRVLEAFHNEGFTVHCTNIVGGMQQYIDSLVKKSVSIGDFSGLEPEYLSGGDRAFYFDGTTTNLS